ncbi:LamG-like jellyroll fold domain-containing protein, partial [Flavobacterium sp. LMO9]
MKTRLLLFFFFVFSFGNAQINVVEGFESGTIPAGWGNNGFNVSNTSSCSGSYSSFFNTFGLGSGASISTPTYVSTGGTITFSCDYKRSNQAGDAVIYLQYYNFATNSWIDLTNNVMSPTCFGLAAIIPAGTIPAGTNVVFKVTLYCTSGTFTFFMDNFSVQESLPHAIAEYNFDSTYNNTIGRNPFLSNAGTSFATDRFGNANGAININNTGTTANFPGLPYGASSKSISVWAKANVINPTINYVFHYGNTAGGNGLAFRTAETLFFAGSGGNLTAASSISAPWAHYVCTYDGTTAKVYKDGVLLSDSALAWNIINNSNTFRLGLTESGGVNYFNGAIDDLKIYNYALSQADVTSLYTNNSLPITAPTISLISVPTILTNEATVNYSLNANNGATTSIVKYGLTSGNLSSQVTGFSASGSLATSGSAQIQGLSSNTTYYYQIEASNSAGTTTSAIGSFTTTALVAIAEYNFDNTYNNILGTNPFQANAGTSFTTDRHGNISAALSINNQGTFATILGLPYNSTSRTISVWAKTNVLNSQINYVFHYGNSANGNGLAFRPTTTLYFANAGANLETADTNTNNTWIHYVCTYDGTTAKVYKNGVLFSSGVKAFNTINNSNIFKLGLTEGAGYNYFNGAIDDLKIYNYALNATEVSSLY